MNLKKLTQAVFDGLPSEYRWAAVDGNGEAHLYNRAPQISEVNCVFGYFKNFTKGCDYLDLGEGFDATDWQNSLIERQDVPTAADIDWSRQDVPAGATHYQPECEATNNGGRYFKDDFNKVLVLTHPENGWIDFPKEQLTPEAYANMLVVPSKPESITDVARSIEAARVAEKSMPWPDGDPRYFETSDAVNNPAHYTTGGIECIDAMQAMLSREEFIGYLRGNIFKYQWRYKHKNGVEDLRKADWYAQRLIRVEGEK